MTDEKPKNPESTGPANLQGDFFNRARRSGEKVTIFLMNGKKLSGRIRAFDRYTILLDAGGTEEVIFKHAVSTVSQSTGARVNRSKPKKRGKRPEGPAEGGSRPPRTSEQPLSHRMDLSSFHESAGGKETAPASAPEPEKPREAPAEAAPPAADPPPAVESGQATETATPAAEDPAAGG